MSNSGREGQPSTERKTVPSVRCWGGLCVCVCVRARDACRPFSSPFCLFLLPPPPAPSSCPCTQASGWCDSAGCRGGCCAAVPAAMMRTEQLRVGRGGRWEVRQVLAVWCVFVRARVCFVFVFSSCFLCYYLFRLRVWACVMAVVLCCSFSSSLAVSIFIFPLLLPSHRSVTCGSSTHSRGSAPCVRLLWVTACTRQ